MAGQETTPGPRSRCRALLTEGYETGRDLPARTLVTSVPLPTAADGVGVGLGGEHAAVPVAVRSRGGGRAVLPPVVVDRPVGEQVVVSVVQDHDLRVVEQLVQIRGRVTADRFEQAVVSRIRPMGRYS